MKRILVPLLALSLLATTGSVLADPPRHAGNPHDRHGYDSRHDDRHDDRHHDHGRGHWQSGQHLPKDHRGAYVSDYRHYGLKAPPPGHQWRRVDNEYLLVAVATGVIASVILASH